MKKLNGMVAGVAIALGVSMAAVAVAQGTGSNPAPNPTGYDCPYYEAGLQGYGPGYGRGHHRGMRGGHRGWNGADGDWGGHRGYHGMGPGMGRGMGMGSYLPHDYMVSLVTPAEMEAYRNDIRTAQSVEACQKVDAAHRKLVEERAASMNVPAPQPRLDVCVEMEKNGWYSRSAQ